MKYKHLFFDMDNTIAPSRQPILPEMFDLLSSRQENIVIVSGGLNSVIEEFSKSLPSYTLGVNGNYATDVQNNFLWEFPLTPEQKQEILQHIDKLVTHLDHNLNPDYNPIEDRGAQITFSPVGNTAPVELKRVYDPDRKVRTFLLEKEPFISDGLTVKFGGTTSLDYFNKDNHKGTNVQRLIDIMNWKNDECVYFGDGLFPGGNDEAVIGVIETVAVRNHLDTYNKLQQLFSK